MSVWSNIVELAARAFDPEADPPAPNQQCAPQPNDVGFTAAVIGLAAKMAKADGEATESELRAAAQRVGADGEAAHGDAERDSGAAHGEHAAERAAAHRGDEADAQAADG